MGKEALSRVEELMNTSRINELIHKREEDEKKKNCILWVLAIIGAVAAVAGIAYAVYRFFTPDYLEDFEDDFDDDFDDDFFEDEKAEEKKSFGIVLINRPLMFSEILLVSEIFVRERGRIFIARFGTSTNKYSRTPIQ